MLTPSHFAASPLELTVGDIVVGKNGSKAAPITSKDGKGLTFLFGTAQKPVHAPFGLSSYGDIPNDRVSLDLRATGEIEACVASIDSAILDYVESNYKKFFGNSMKADKVREYFRPTLKIDETGKYEPLVKTKLSRSRVKVWGEHKEPLSISVIEPHCDMRVSLLLRSVWFQSKNWGVTLEAQHIRLANNIPQCPFSDADESDS